MAYLAKRCNPHCLQGGQAAGDWLAGSGRGFPLSELPLASHIGSSLLSERIGGALDDLPAEVRAIGRLPRAVWSVDEAALRGVRENSCHAPAMTPVSGRRGHRSPAVA